MDINIQTRVKEASKKVEEVFLDAINYSGGLGNEKQQHVLNINSTIRELEALRTEIIKRYTQPD